jgi:hypothetical protein
MGKRINAEMDTPNSPLSKTTAKEENLPISDLRLFSVWDGIELLEIHHC